ncbi:forkhead box protein N2-like [Ambystoma mexicanum]|uniref:forkhead box protein N2-like n=1 Tax=Ambystoma mexicanum TaxID=8296 RepID=UPI0037E9B714
MERPELHPETLVAASTGRGIRVSGGGTVRADGDLTNLDWLHKNKNLLRGLHLEREARVKTALAGSTEDPPMPEVGRGHCLAKPPYSFSSLIFMAIEESQSKCLPVKDIYNWILDTFPYYKEASLGWKNSVRHNLSLSKCFRKVQTDGAKIEGKGSLWCVEPKFRHLLIEGLRKNWCGQSSETLRQDTLGQTLQDAPSSERQDFTSGETGGGGSGQQDDAIWLAEYHRADHNYSILNIQVVPAAPAQLQAPTGQGMPANGGCLELLVFADHSGSRLDWCIEAMGLVEVDSEAQEAAGSLLHLAGIQ